MTDLEKIISPDANGGLCAICDNAVEDSDVASVVSAHGCKWLVHTICIDIADEETLDRAEEQEVEPVGNHAMTTLTTCFLFAAVQWADRVAASSKRLIDCPHCGGDGFLYVEIWRTPECNIGPCPDCDGTGEIEIEAEPIDEDDCFKEESMLIRLMPKEPRC